MKISAIIAEYNPFHNGHLYHLNKTKTELKPDITIAIMSGNFVQRGKMAVIPKDIRAKIAIENGFDIVIELPTLYAINNAEYFSFGAINLIKNIPNTTLSFGSECGDINKLTKIANLTKTEEYNKLLKQNLTNNSYAVSSVNALNTLANNFSGSNNILAIEYLKAIENFGNKITPYTIKRIDNYNDINIKNEFISASAIRDLKNKEYATNYMPKNSFDALDFKINNKAYEDFVLSTIFNIKNEELKNILDVSEGLENRIKDAINKTNNFEDFIKEISTKRYSNSRINRILLNAVLDIKKDDYLNYNLDYASVLAIKKSKINMLGYLNNYTKIITKYADTKLLTNKEKQIYDIDIKANKLYSIVNNYPVKNNMQIID